MLNSVLLIQGIRRFRVGGKIVDKQMFAGVLSHPVRCRALTILADREASPVEIARELDLEPSHVAYHVRLLHDEGLIELTEEVPRRGSIEHRYQAVYFAQSDACYAEVTAEERATLARVIFSFAAADANCAFSAGTFAARPDHHISRFPMQVDETGWTEMNRLYDQMLAELYRIRQESGDRLDESGDEGRPVLAFSTLFELPTNRVIPRRFPLLAPVE
jgi:DNA-binding transcriptional ArsR family regulator